MAFPYQLYGKKNDFRVFRKKSFLPYTKWLQTFLYDYTILPNCKHLYMNIIYYKNSNISILLYYTIRLHTYPYDYTKLNDCKHLHTIILNSKTGKFYIILYYTANMGWQSDLFCKGVDLAQEWFVTEGATQSSKPTWCSHGCFTLLWVVILLFYGLWKTLRTTTPEWWVLEIKCLDIIWLFFATSPIQKDFKIAFIWKWAINA